MKHNFSYSIISYSMVFLFVFLFSCTEPGNTPTPTKTVDPFTGIRYKFTSGKLAADNGHLKAGADATRWVTTGLFAVNPCSAGKSGGFELKTGGELTMICTDEPAKDKKAGQWKANADNTELTLTLSKPPFPSAFSITIKKITLTGNDLTGEGVLPVAKWIIDGVAPPTNPLDLTNPLNVPSRLTITLTFTKI